MKKLKLDTVHQKSSFFVHLLDKTLLEVAVTYNVLTRSLAENISLSDIENKLMKDYTDLCININTLKSILGMLDRFSNIVSYTSDSEKILENVTHTLELIGNHEQGSDHTLTFLSRAIVLINSVFVDIQKLKAVFVTMCRRLGFNYNTPLVWADEANMAITDGLEAL